MLCARDARRRPAASEQPRVEHARRRRSPARIHIKHAKNPPRPPTAKTRAGLLRHVHRRPAGGAHRDDPPRRRRAQDGRELPLPLHGREGCRGRVPLFSNSVAQWIAYQTSNLGVAGSSPVGVVSPIARRPFSIRGRVGLSSVTTSHEGVGFKPQSLRRRGFEPHRMHMNAADATPDGLENLKVAGSTPASVSPRIGLVQDSVAEWLRR